MKTGMYYLRSKPATDAIKFTIDPRLVAQAKAAAGGGEATEADVVDTRTVEERDEDEERLACSRDNPGACTMCSA